MTAANLQADPLKLAFHAIEVLRSNCGRLSPSASMLVANAIAAMVEAQNTVHPDTVRLNHLIEWDRSIIGGLNWDETEIDGTLEKIEFIFENCSGDDGAEAVRAAIDQSMKVQP